MSRRLLGVLLCAVLVGVSAFSAYADATKKNFTFTLNIETSYFSLDSLDDFSDTSHPARAINWSSRDKVTGKFMLGAKVRRIKFTPPALILCAQRPKLDRRARTFFAFRKSSGFSNRFPGFFLRNVTALLTARHGSRSIFLPSNRRSRFRSAQQRVFPELTFA